MASNSDGAEASEPPQLGPVKESKMVFFQKSDMDSLDKVFRGMSIRESFPGSKDIFKAINGELLAVSPKAVVVCMKTDCVEDILFCVRFGWMTNNEACSKRMAKIWNERKDERVFLMFSVKGSKQFCALAEMVAQVDFDAEIDGWSKPNCKGALRVLFHYVKNVPFSVINHLYHQANGQPVANMWNSMVYNDGNGLQVIKHYVEHPVYASILALEPGCDFFSTTRLLIQSSGSSSYSASSYTSQNDKPHDPRAIINPNTGGSSGSRVSKERDLNGSWRSKTSSPGTADGAEATSFNMDKGAGSSPRTAERKPAATGVFRTAPPAFTMSTQKPPRGTNTFTTQDDQTIATFQSGTAHSYGTATHAPLPSPRPGSYQARGGFGAGRGGFGGGSGRGLRSGPPAHINTVWRGGGPGGFGGSIRGLHSPNPLHSGMHGYQNMPSPGFVRQMQHHGNVNLLAASQQQADPYKLTIHEFLDQTGISAALHGSLPPGGDPFVENGPSQGTPFQHNGGQDQMQRDHTGKPMPHSAQAMLEGAGFDGYTTDEFVEARRESPMKHYRSMPDFSQTPKTRLDAGVADFVPHSARNAAFPSGSRDKLQQQTPTHRPSTTSESKNLNLSAATQSPFLEDDAVARMSPARQVQYYTAVEEMVKGLRQGAEARTRLAGFKHEEARGELASSTVESLPATSPPTLARVRNNLNAPSAVTTSSIEVQNIEQFVGRDGRPLRSVSARRKPADIGHRRGDVESFTSSFDARVTRQALDLVEDSPSRNQAMRNGRYEQYALDDRGRRGPVRFVSPPQMGPLYSSPIGSSSRPESARSTDSHGFADTILSYPGSDDHGHEQTGYRSRSTESQSSYGGVPLVERKHK